MMDMMATNMEPTVVTERSRMMKQIQSYGFAAFDLSLYLNTHPNDKRAIQMHTELVRKAQEAIEAFQKKYGPLTSAASTNPDRWDWIDSPWPWENE